MDFYGFNGYMAHYDHERVAMGKDKQNLDPQSFIYTPKYRINRLALLFKTDFVGNIWDKKLFWAHRTRDCPMGRIIHLYMQRSI